MEGPITKENIAYALMGTYEHLWGICDLRDYSFDSRNTNYSFRPTRVWYEIVIGRNVTYIVFSFLLTIVLYESNIPTNYTTQMIIYFLIKFAEI